jgi:hypothetical protein
MLTAALRRREPVQSAQAELRRRKPVQSAQAALRRRESEQSAQRQKSGYPSWTPLGALPWCSAFRLSSCV